MEMLTAYRFKFIVLACLEDNYPEKLEFVY